MLSVCLSVCLFICLCISDIDSDVCVCKAEQLAADAECKKAAVTSSVSSCDDLTSVTSTSSAAPSSGYVSAAVQPPAAKAPPTQHKRPSTRCPYRVIEICNTCWTRSNSKDVVMKSTKANQCSKVGHPWIGISFLILPCKKLLGSLPPTIPRNLNFAICWDLARQKRCRRPDCSFAHCEEEIAVWKWMVQNNGK